MNNIDPPLDRAILAKTKYGWEIVKYEEKESMHGMCYGIFSIHSNICNCCSERYDCSVEEPFEWRELPTE